MSETTQDQIAMMIRRGVPEHDPRIQGLRRRIEADKEALDKAKETAQRLRVTHTGRAK